MLRYFSRNIRGSDNYWIMKTEELEQWIAHHIACGRGPPKFFIAFSYVEKWWPDLRCLLAQLEYHAGNKAEGDAIRANNFNEMSAVTKNTSFLLNDFFIKRSKNSQHSCQ